MNYVELVNALRIESGSSGSTVTTVQGPMQGEPERLRKWIADAWCDIQRRHVDWRFMFVESTHTIPVNGSLIEPTEFLAGGVAEWHVDSFRMAEAGQARKDSNALPYRDYFYFRDHDGLDVSIPGKPTVFTIHPTTEAIMLAPASDKERILFYDYWRTPQVLTDDDHVPIIAPRYHDLIVYWALQTYGAHEAAPEALIKAADKVKQLMSDLELDQLPGMETATLC